MVGTYWWLIGAKVFFSGPWFPIFQIVMIVRDHRQHRDWRSTILAVVWPLMCVSMIYVLQGSMDPPLFGIPLAILFLTAWWRNMWVFMPGVVLYYATSAVVLIVSAQQGSASPLALSVALAHILCAPVHVALFEDAGVVHGGA